MRNDRQSDTKEKIDAETTCDKCGKRIPATKQEHIKHWKECGLPDNKPTHIEVETWWNIKDRVKE